MSGTATGNKPASATPAKRVRGPKQAKTFAQSFASAMKILDPLKATDRKRVLDTLGAMYPNGGEDPPAKATA